MEKDPLSDYNTPFQEIPTGAIEQLPADSKPRRILKTLAWFLVGLMAISVFTIVKLPEERLKNYIEGTLATFLAPKGIVLKSEKAKISLGLGVSYTMKDVTISFPPPAPPVKIEEIEVSPSLLSFLVGKVGGKFWISQGESRLDGAFTMKSSEKNPEVDLSFKAKKLDIGRIGLLQFAGGLRGAGQVSGSCALSGDLSTPSTWTGNLDLEAAKLVLDQQPVFGFNIPRIEISEAKIHVAIAQAKAIIDTVKIGRPGSPDDLIGTVTGDVALGRTLTSSLLNLKTRFFLSQKIIKSMVLIDALLGAGKLPDGGYSYSLTGPVYSPVPTPAR